LVAHLAAVGNGESRNEHFPRPAGSIIDDMFVVSATVADPAYAPVVE
jgi:hypothetical protein